MTTVVSLIERIERDFPTLSRQLQLAGRYVVDHPDEVALASMRALSRKAKVSPSTMLRLARATGFEDYESFRETFRQRIRRRGEGPFAARARSLQMRWGEVDVGALVNDISAAESGNLARTFSPDGAAQLARAAEALRDSRRVYVAAMRSCFPVAFFFHYALGMVRDEVHLLNGTGGTLLDNLRPIGPGDGLVVAGFQPYTRETVLACQFARTREAQVIAITDSAVSPLARAANESVIVANQHPSFFQSIIGATAAAQALVALLVARGGESVVEALAERERHLAQFGAYWDGATKGKRSK
jgi:DNA-binding MurR/RpiR family transcriptional regulator